MILDAANIQAIGTGLSAFIATLVTCFLLLTAYQERTARTLGYAFLFVLVWAWFGFFYSLADNLALARNLRIISLFGETIFVILFAQLAFVYVAEKRPLRTWEMHLKRWFLGAGYVIAGLFFIDLFGTQFMVGDLLTLPHLTLAPVRGPLFSALTVYFFLSIALLIVVPASRILQEKGKKRRIGIILFGSLALALLVGGTGFSQWYGFNFLSTVRILAVPLFAVSAIYAITNYRLFNLQVAVAQFFVYAIWTFMFFRVLLYPTLADAILFGALIVLGLFLVRSATRETRTRIKLQEVSEELRVLNTSLEEKVKERTAALARASAHVAAVVENLPTGLIETDATGRIARMNAAAEELFGVTFKALENSTAPAGSELAALLSKAKEEGEFDSALSKPRKRDLLVTTTPLQLPEGGAGFITIIRDVTRERALDRAKSDFVATATHQLRTPLAAIKWVFNLLEEAKRLPKKTKEVVVQGATGAAKMERIIESLFLSLRTAEGTTQYRFEEIDAVEIAEGVIKALRPLAKKKRISLKFTPAENTSHIQADPTMLSYVIQNLVDNAIKYTPTGGVIQVSIGPSKEGLQFRVSDNGIGFTEEEKEHLFERFYRSPRATKLFTDGSGMGLFILKSIMEAHKGSITVDSHEDKGTIFTCLFPFSPEAKN